jgi:hypothetical protein
MPVRLMTLIIVLVTASVCTDYCQGTAFFCPHARMCIGAEERCNYIPDCWYGQDELNCSEYFVFCVRVMSITKVVSGKYVKSQHKLSRLTARMVN